MPGTKVCGIALVNAPEGGLPCSAPTAVAGTTKIHGVVWGNVPEGCLDCESPTGVVAEGK